MKLKNITYLGLHYSEWVKIKDASKYVTNSGNIVIINKNNALRLISVGDVAIIKKIKLKHTSAKYNDTINKKICKDNDIIALTSNDYATSYDPPDNHIKTMYTDLMLFGWVSFLLFCLVSYINIKSSYNSIASYVFSQT